MCNCTEQRRSLYQVSQSSSGQALGLAGAPLLCSCGRRAGAARSPLVFKHTENQVGQVVQLCCMFQKILSLRADQRLPHSSPILACSNRWNLVWHGPKRATLQGVHSCCAMPGCIKALCDGSASAAIRGSLHSTLVPRLSSNWGLIGDQQSCALRLRHAALQQGTNSILASWGF